jgi:hypothetical protein
LKVQFYQYEGARALKFEDGKMTADSLNITTAMIFLKKNNPSIDDIRKLKENAYLNNPGEKARSKIDSRLNAYFF